jgi:hypothetical protein
MRPVVCMPVPIVLQGQVSERLHSNDVLASEAAIPNPVPSSLTAVVHFKFLQQSGRDLRVQIASTGRKDELSSF